MSGQDDADEERRYAAPYSSRHHIPTIHKYEEVKAAREAQAVRHRTNEDVATTDRTQAHRQLNHNDQGYDVDGRKIDSQGKETSGIGTRSTGEEQDGIVDTSEIPNTGPGNKRKGVRQRKQSGAEREVTDPVTHLPVTIHDFTSSALENVEENEPTYGSTPRTATGLSNKRKSSSQLESESREIDYGHRVLQNLFPPPDYDLVRDELIAINRLGITVGLVGVAFFIPALYGVHSALRTLTLPAWGDWLSGSVPAVILAATGAVGIWLFVAGTRDWVTSRVENVWEDAIWESSAKADKIQPKGHDAESVQWLNSLLAAVWPLVNPDLFTSLADTLEDVMQASLPRLVRMVSVDDIGQGGESIRILGIKWLPTGAAARSVLHDGRLKSQGKDDHPNDRSVPGEGEVEANTELEEDNEAANERNSPGTKEVQHQAEDGTMTEMAEGMEAEEGDFINLEVAFAYRARTSGSLSDRIKDIHLHLAFYLPGNIKIPVFVDLRGVIGTMRMRLQLTPDPPFFGLMTMTLLGQPKVDIGCMPLIRKGPNIMEIPLLKNFIQSSVDAAMSEYVAPKSLTLDLKDMLAGDDFKKDTDARGVLVVHIKRGYDFRTGDPGIPLIKKGGADPFVSVGFAKFGKPLWSTRILLKEMEPCWHETAYLLVTAQELNVDERLRVQLWDSDRLTADDDLGRIELDLKQLMKGESNGKMQQRTDGFRALKAGEDMPGKLEWSVGYFSKVRLQQCQLEKQTVDPKIRTFDALAEKVDQVCRRKLREAFVKEGGNGSASTKDERELEQQKRQELKTRQDAMIISAPPPDEFHSGILSIEVHQATGLTLQKLRKDRKDYGTAGEQEDEEGEELPSAYCSVIINHKKIFKTRTKPHNPKPFFNAATERFIADYRSAEVFISVRDARVHEDDPLLGIVHLPLAQVLQDRSQIDGYYPLLGGMGYGRVRLSLVWRSVQLQAPARDLGWDFGTVEVQGRVDMDSVPRELRGMKIKLTTDLSHGKLYPKEEDSAWLARGKRSSLKLAVRKRYSSCMTIQFRTHGIMSKKTDAFATLWLHTIPDEEEQEVSLPIYKETKGGKDRKRAMVNCVEGSGEKLGEVTIKLTFWSGLGHVHSHWASQDQNTRDVVEVLEVANDNYETHQRAKAVGIVDSDDTSDSDDDSSENEHDDDSENAEKQSSSQKKPKFSTNRNGSEAGKDSIHDAADRHHAAERAEMGADGNAEQEDDGKQSVLDRARDYKKHLRQTHRQHRGVMQWKLPRTAQWAVRKAESVEHRMSGLFKHSSREPDIETEV